MASAPPAERTIERIESLDDLRRIADEVRTEKKSRLVSIPGGGEITIASVRKQRRRMTPEEKEEADRQAFLSSAGGWVGLVDGEEFKRQYRAARGLKRPPVVIDWPDE